MGNNEMLAVLPYIVLFSLISIIAITTALIAFGINNDYVFYNLQNVSDKLAADGIIKNTTAAQTLSYFQNYRNIPPQLDYLWFGIYCMFFIATVTYSYQAGRIGYVGVFSYLFFGLLFLLFLASVIQTLTDWWHINILMTMLTNLELPMFEYYLQHCGVFILIQVVACFLANVVDFDLSKLGARKLKEQEAIDNEVL